MSRLLYRVGHSAGRHPWRVLAVWLLIAVSAFVLNGAVGGAPNDTFSLPGAEAQAGADKLTRPFPAQSVYSSQVVLHSDEGLTTKAAELAVADAVDGPRRRPARRGREQSLRPARTHHQRGRHHRLRDRRLRHRQDRAAGVRGRRVGHEVLRDADIQVEYNGLLGVAKGEQEPGSEMIGIAVAIIVLAIAFGSLVAMSLPIAVALIGLLVGSSSIGILSGYLTVPSITTIVASMLGLGVGIDYALFILARHRQHLDEGMPVPEAVGRANATAGLSVLFAGVTVVVAIAGLQVAGIPMLTMMGWGSALMVGIVMLAAVTLLPGLLGLAGRKVNSLRVPFVRQRPANDPTPGRPAGLPAWWPARCATPSSPWSCSASSRLRSPPCGSASPTTATWPRRAPCASPTTCSPTASAPASTARSRSRSRPTARPTTPRRSRPSPPPSRPTPASRRCRRRRSARRATWP